MSILLLQHTRSDGEVDTYHLKSVRRYHLGRGSDCEIRMLDMKMSRRHAAIERQGSEWVLHDLGSTNGAKIDGVRIQGSVVLRPGQTIRIGNSDLVVADIENITEHGGAHTSDDLTPVRQEALPAAAEDDEHPDRNVEDAPRQNQAPSNEFDLTDAPEAESEVDHDPALEPTPRRTRQAQPAEGGSESSRVRPVVVQTDALPRGESQLFINLLGRRVGPLTHAQARELKARELKGTLTADDLADYPIA